MKAAVGVERGGDHEMTRQASWRGVARSLALVLVVIAALGSALAGSAPADAKTADGGAPASSVARTKCTLSIMGAGRSANTAIYFYNPPDNWARSFWVNGTRFDLGPNESISAPVATDGFVRYPDENSKVSAVDLTSCAKKVAAAYVLSRRSSRQSQSECDSTTNGLGSDESCCPPDASGQPVEGDCDEDSDQDGLDDRNEKQRGTNPFEADSDGDGLRDGVELLVGSDPLVPSRNLASLPFFMKKKN